MVKTAENKISPLMFKKYFGGIGPSNLTKKAKKTESKINKISEIKKNKNLVLRVILKIFLKNFILV